MLVGSKGSFQTGGAQAPPGQPARLHLNILTGKNSLPSPHPLTSPQMVGRALRASLRCLAGFPVPRRGHTTEWPSHPEPSGCESNPERVMNRRMRPQIRPEVSLHLAPHFQPHPDRKPDFGLAENFQLRIAKMGSGGRMPPPRCFRLAAMSSQPGGVRRRPDRPHDVFET